MDGERGRCCDEVIMVKTLTAEARLWVDRYSSVKFIFAVCWEFP